MLDRELVLHLSLIEGVGPATILTITRTKSESFSLNQLYAMSATDVYNQFHIPFQISQKIVAGLLDITLLSDELKRIERADVTWYTIIDPDYPQMLSHIHLPPAVLYTQGAPLSSDAPHLAIVGSRDANAYAKRVIDTFMPEFALSGLCIVSGGARGVDAYAHAAALENGASTIAVMGSGLLYRYPAANKRLFEAILARTGTLLSCFPLDTPPAAGLFPARNRIIAGLSRGTLVVQAAEKSGALITAHFALNQGRDVFAVPGSVEDPLSAGCHNLIKQGAHIASSAVGVINELGFEQVHTQKIIKEASEQQMILPIAQEQTVEQSIIDACIRPTTIDEIALQTNVTVSQLHELLFSLMLAGSISQNSAGLWHVGR